MDPTVAAILAAGIPAAVASLTFTVSEVIRARRTRDQQIADAVSELAAALAWVVVVEDRPWPVRRWHFTEAITRSAAASTALLATVRRRDRIFAYWIVTSSQTALGPVEDRVEWSAKITTELRLWQMNPHDARQRAYRALGHVPRNLTR